MADAGALKGRVALITGATRGIGWATAQALADAGASVVLVARHRDALDARVAALGAHRASAIVCDLGEPAQCEQAVSAVMTAGGAPDLLINNAGIFELATVEQTAVTDFARALHANVLAPFIFIRHLLPHMRARRSGHIITIGSVADRTVFPENGAYAATKTGLRALHEVLRIETQGSGVRTSLVSPGPVDTSLWDPIDPDSRPGFPPRAAMLRADAVADAVRFVATRDPAVNIDELRLSRS